MYALRTGHGPAEYLEAREKGVLHDTTPANSASLSHTERPIMGQKRPIC